MLRRFTGGGTVYLDENSLLVSFVCSESGSKPVYPNALMEWSANAYARLFSPHVGFKLVGHDYTVGDSQSRKKIGGNAQAISGRRFVHHTSFLYDFDVSKLDDNLTLPNKRPEYRDSRPHGDFLVCFFLFFRPSYVSRAVRDRFQLKTLFQTTLHCHALQMTSSIASCAKSSTSSRKSRTKDFSASTPTRRRIRTRSDERNSFPNDTFRSDDNAHM